LVVEEMARAGNAVRYLHSTIVPRDEFAFVVFEAGSMALVEEAYTRAGVRFDRIVDALDLESTDGEELR
jgi:hypothetical protein